MCGGFGFGFKGEKKCSFKKKDTVFFKKLSIACLQGSILREAHDYGFVFGFRYNLSFLQQSCVLVRTFFSGFDFCLL